MKTETIFDYNLEKIIKTHKKQENKSINKSRKKETRKMFFPYKIS